MFVNNVARIVFSPVGLPGRRMTFEGQHYSLSGTAAINKMISAMTERTPIALEEDNKVMAAMSMTTDPFALEIGLYANDSPPQQSSAESHDEKEDGLPSVLYAMNSNYRSAASSPSQASGEHVSSSASSPQASPKAPALFGITSADLHNKMPIHSLVSNTNQGFNVNSPLTPPSPQSQLAQMSPFVQVVQPDEGVNETNVLDFFNTASNVNSYDDNSLPLTPNGSVAQWFRQ